MLIYGDTAATMAATIVSNLHIIISEVDEAKAPLALEESRFLETYFR